MTTTLDYYCYYQSNNENEKFIVRARHDASFPIYYGDIDFNINSYETYDYSTIIGYQDTHNTLDRTCNGEVIIGPSSFNENYCSDYAYFFENEEGNVKLSINNTVNGVMKYDATNNRELNYKIEIKNTGDAGSSKNVITTFVPEEIKVLEESISNNGVYNESSDTIVWNVDFIDEGETIEFTYSATAPTHLNGSDLVGLSSIKSNQVSMVQSSETIVTMNRSIDIAKNPKTGTTGLYIPYLNLYIPLYIFVIMFICAFISVLLLKRKKR